MITRKSKAKSRRAEPFIARSSAWVKENDVMGLIADPFSDQKTEVHAHVEGLVIGRTNIPLVHEGEALFHIGRFESSEEVASHVEAFHAGYLEPPEARPSAPSEESVKS